MSRSLESQAKRARELARKQRRERKQQKKAAARDVTRAEVTPGGVPGGQDASAAAL
jgi:hypothetical protein